MATTRMLLGLLATSALVSGCGGGSGGGDGGIDPAQVTGPARFQTEEYRRMGGHDVVKAAEGYDIRQTGQEGGRGRLISIVDSGVEDHFELDIAAKFALVGTPFDDPAPHGTAVAGVAAARKNGTGVHGVAFNARIVSHKIAPPDFSNTNQLDEEGVIALAIASAAGVDTTYVLDDGSIVPTNTDGEADIINMSFTTTDFTGQVLDAMRRSAQAGKIMTVALGNSALIRPVSAPAIYVTDPLVAGLGIAVGALDPTGTTDASFSNLCGNVRQFCIFAPGEQITSTIPGDRFATVSGTSFAAPYVAGAAAVVQAAFPTRGPRDIVNRILRTADDIGDPGTDDRFGRGRLNLERALNPVGFASVPLGDAMGGDVVGLEGTGMTLPAWANGKPLAASLSDVLIHDSMDFPFRVDLSGSVRGAGIDDRLDDFLAPASRVAGEITADEDRLSLSLARDTSQPLAGTESRYASHLREDEVDAYRVGVALGEDTRLTVGRGWGTGPRHVAQAQAMAGADLGFVAEGLQPFARLASADDGLALETGIDDATTLEISLAEGEMRDGGGKGRLGSMTLTRALGENIRLSSTIGMLQERQSVLGGRALGAAGSLSAETRYMALTATADVGQSTALFGSFTSGWTNDVGADPGLLRSMTVGRSEAYALGIAWREISGADQLSLAVSQPLRPTSARASLDVPVGEGPGGSVIRERRRVDLSPDGRERSVQLVYRRNLDEHDLTFSVGAFARFEPDHDADASTDLGAGMRIGYRF